MIVMVSLCLGAVLAPVSVAYATAQLFSISDATTGAVAVVGTAGTLNVESRAGVPQRSFNWGVKSVTVMGTLLARSTPTDRLAITELTFFHDSSIPSRFRLIVYTDGGKVPEPCPAIEPFGITGWDSATVRMLQVGSASSGVTQVTFNGPPLLLPDDIAPTSCLYGRIVADQPAITLGGSGYRY